MLLPARKGAEEMGMETFLVKVWVAADDTQPPAELRGVVRHVTTGVETTFRGDAEVLDLLRFRRAGARKRLAFDDPKREGEDPNV
jgi:hypothetical protein